MTDVRMAIGPGRGRELGPRLLEFRAAAAVDSGIEAESGPGAIICTCILHFTSSTGVLIENKNQYNFLTMYE
jgi:hypothetical protein